MSIKIHHGPPGSYKTSGAIADDLPKAVLAGRHIITNVRGLSDELRIRDVLEGQGKSVPDSFRLTYIKTDPTDTDNPDASCSENMEMLRRFWHWSPDGAFFILDEVQEIWPKTYRETHLKKLNYPGGIEQANADGRFLDIALAFEKHRHKNWDFIVTTPNINKVHPVVRGSAEAAYKHKNLAMLGNIFKGRYVEGFHGADTNGRASDFYSVTKKRIPPYVFDLYKSTATGVVQDTTAGTSIFANPRVLLLLVIICAVFVFVFTAGLPKIFGGGDKNATKLDEPPLASPPVAGGGAPVPPAAAANIDRVSNTNRPLVAAGQSLAPPLLTYISKGTLYYSGGFGFDPDSIKLVVDFPDGSTVRLAKNQLLRGGLHLVDRGDCLAELFVNGRSHTFVSCPPAFSPPDEPDMRLDAPPSLASNAANPFATPQQ